MSFLARVGGSLVAPRATAARFVATDEGRAEHLLPLWLLAGGAASPERLGGAILIARARPFEGATAIFGALTGKLGPSVGVALVAAVVLFLVERRRGRAFSFARAIDLGAHLTLPSIALLAIGAGLAGVGLEVPVLPHRPLAGPAWLLAARFVVGYGPSLALLFAVAWTRLRATDAPTAPPPPEPRSRDRSGLALTLLMGLAFALVLRRVVLIASGPPPPGEGVVAPEFRVAILGGGEVALGGLRGKVVIADFWATWCPPCVASLPVLDRLHRELGPGGLVVLALNQEPGEVEAVRRFARDRGLTLPIGLDPGEIARAYGVVSLPTSFVIDRAGVVRFVHHGAPAALLLESEVKALLAEGR